MNINSGIKQAVILTIGIIMLGFCIKSGLESVISKDRKVVVKGLAEKEVEADKVTWPIVSKEICNDLPELYQKINATTRTIRNFLVANGVKASEINVNAPVVIDLNADVLDVVGVGSQLPFCRSDASVVVSDVVHVLGNLLADCCDCLLVGGDICRIDRDVLLGRSDASVVLLNCLLVGGNH